MLIRRKPTWALKESDVTPESVYFNRRSVLKALGIAGSVAGGAGAGLLPPPAFAAEEPTGRKLKFSETDYGEGLTPTPYEDVTTYNNFYEFGTGKSDPAANAGRMQTEPWSVRVSGECMKPGTYSYDDLVKPGDQEERIYRLRCVEAWSMIIPWVGVPLATILQKFEPTSNAKYVRFVTYLNRDTMPGTRLPVLDWPYEEGLRIDEAMHPLTLMVTGLYGRELPNQNGAPMRLMMPWKYGFKSIKSIVEISFVEDEPPTSWNKAAPREYGFYANVNPEVDHPRWSQATERVIGGEGGLRSLFSRQDTLMFNGYGDEVASLYQGMDLRKNY